MRRAELGPVQSKGKETTGVSLMAGARPDQHASSSQTFVAHEAQIPHMGFGPNNQGFSHQPNYIHYNPMFEPSQPKTGQAPEQCFWPHQMNVQGQFPAPQGAPRIQPLHAPINREQLVEAIHEEYGPILRRVGRPTYRQPYPDHIDRVEIPQGYKVPNFTLFSGDGEQSTVEHIGWFIV